MTALFVLYLTFCPAEVTKVNSTCHTEFRGQCEYQRCLEISKEAEHLYSPHKRIISMHIRENRK